MIGCCWARPPEGTGFRAIVDAAVGWAPRGHTLAFEVPDWSGWSLMTWPSRQLIDQAPACGGYQGVAWSPDAMCMIFVRGASTRCDRSGFDVGVSELRPRSRRCCLSPTQARGSRRTLDPRLACVAYGTLARFTNAGLVYADGARLWLTLYNQLLLR